MSVRARTILTWANTRKQSSFTAPLQLYLVDALATAALAAAILVMSWRPARLSTYLVDFYCYRPPDRCQFAFAAPADAIRTMPSVHLCDCARCAVKWATARSPGAAPMEETVVRDKAVLSLAVYTPHSSMQEEYTFTLPCAGCRIRWWTCRRACGCRTTSCCRAPSSSWRPSSRYLAWATAHSCPMVGNRMTHPDLCAQAGCDMQQPVQYRESTSAKPTLLNGTLCIGASLAVYSLPQPGEQRADERCMRPLRTLLLNRGMKTRVCRACSGHGGAEGRDRYLHVQGARGDGDRAQRVHPEGAGPHRAQAKPGKQSSFPYSLHSSLL